jgi:glycosyltransferase involved in cell wall biosynthesis
MDKFHMSKISFDKVKTFNSNNFIYIFSNPFGRPDSGINSYISYALHEFKRMGINTSVITRFQAESIASFRRRLANEVRQIKSEGKSIIIEAPESDASTLEIPLEVADIHIRLHCSRQLGAWVQEQRIDKKLLALEQVEILRARYLSAPSQSAVIVSQALFRIQETVYCYPNPAPKKIQKFRTAVEPGYVLFVGRFHRLKGTQWVFEIARRLPEVSFVLLLPELSSIKFADIPPNIRFFDGLENSKGSFFSDARAVILPSIYETASMVAIEAISVGTPVLAWGHLGIVEYAKSPLVVAIEPFDLSAFCSALRHTLTSAKPVIKTDIANYLNYRFFAGFVDMLSGSCSLNMPVPVDQRAIKIFFEKVNSSEVSMYSYFRGNSWLKKLRKLRRDPVRFVKDSRMYRWIVPPGDEIKEKFTSNKKLYLKNNETELKSQSNFCSITANKKIYFSKPPEKPVGFITAFLYSVHSQDIAQKIISELEQIQDFRYLRPPMLQIGTFEDIGDVTAESIVSRIDLANKKNISGIDHLVLLNPSPALVEALRACGTRQRLIVLLSGTDASLPDPCHTDVLIVTKSKVEFSDAGNWRRKIVVSDDLNFSNAIRRAIQEGTPKSPDMLLPIFGTHEFDGRYLLQVDTRFFQGLIKVDRNLPLQSGPVKNQYISMAQSMTGLAVTESVYLKYRTQCDRLCDPEVRARFLSYSLQDGVIFDVRN